MNLKTILMITAHGLGALSCQNSESDVDNSSFEKVDEPVCAFNSTS